MKIISHFQIALLIFLNSCVSQKATESTKGEVNAESPFAQSKVHLPGLNSDSTVTNPKMSAKEKLALENAKAAAAAAKAAEEDAQKAQLIAQQKAEADQAAQNAASKAAAEKAAADAAAAVEAARKATEQLELAKKAAEAARVAAELDAQKNLSAEKIQLDFVVNDECLINRKKDKDAGQLTPDYFVDKHLTEEFYTKARGEFPESAMTFPISKSISASDILRLADADACIVGISEHKEGTALASDTSAALEENDYRAHLQADAADSFFSKAKGTNVKIAVIDTGADYNNADLEPTLSKMEGLSVLKKGYYAEALSSLPQDTHGHGTEMASVISALGKKGVKGLAASAGVQVLPIKVEGLENGIKGLAHNERLGSIMLFNTIKRAVNTGADVINLSLSGFYFFGKETTAEEKARNKMLLCDPMIGYALYRAIERGVVVVMAAGHVGRAEWNAAKKDYDYFPDSVEENLDNKFWDGTAAVTPACWGRYFKGAIAVGALDSTNSQIASFSNWGKGSIEMLAPGTGIKSYSVNGAIKNGQGTSYSTALVSAAVALTIAKHKKNGWKYSPWLIEDVLLNGTPQVSKLATGAKSIFKGRSLNLNSLAEYIKGLESKTVEEREKEPTENPEEGLEFKAPKVASENEYLNRLEVYTKNIIASNRGRIQLQAIAHYNTGSFKVVTSGVVWSSSDETKLKIEGGIAYPVGKPSGIVTLAGTYQGKAASTPVALFDGDIVTGTRDFEQITSLEWELSLWHPNKKFLDSEEVFAPVSDFKVAARHTPFTNIKLFAVYNTGLKREITQEASYFTSSTDVRASSWTGGGGLWFNRSVFGKSQHEVGALYKGQSIKLKLKVPEWEIKEPPSWKIFTHLNPEKKTAFSKSDNYLNIDVLDTHTLFEEKIELVNSQNIVKPLENAIVFLRGLAPDTYRIRAYLEHRGQGGRIKRTYTSHEFTVLDNQPIKAEFTVPYKICPLGNSFQKELVYTWGDGTRTYSGGMGQHFVRIRKPSSVEFRNSGGVTQYLIVGEELKGQKITVEGWIEDYPNVVASYECEVENTLPYAHENYKTLTRPTVISTYPSSRKAASSVCQTEGDLTGEGTPDNPFVICNSEQLKEVMNVDSQSIYTLFSQLNLNIYQTGYVAKLGNHIDLSSENRESFPFVTSNVFQFLSLDGDGYEMHGLNIVDKEFDFRFTAAGQKFMNIKNLNVRDFSAAVRSFNFINSTNIENLKIKNLILQLDGDASVVQSSKDLLNVAVEDVNVVQSTGSAVLLIAESKASRISVNKVKFVCAVKYNCYNSIAITAGREISSSGIWNTESSFYNLAQLMSGDVLAANTLLGIKLRARYGAPMHLSSGDTYSQYRVGAGYNMSNALILEDKYLLDGAKTHLKRSTAYGNYLELDVEGEASAGAFSDGPSGNQASLVERNTIKGTYKSNNCAGAIVGELKSFMRFVSNRVEATVVQHGNGYGNAVGCLITPKFNGSERYLSPLFENNIISGPMLGRDQSGKTQLDFTQDNQPYAFAK